MPSPFPGMNPYLEQDDVWHDFHQRFATVVAEMIGAQVAARYIVKLDEHAYIHELAAEQRQVGLPGIDVERQPFVEIRDRAGRKVIAVIELLSPSNKEAGPDREQYLVKRGQLLNSSAHLVEIDLLRRGGRLPPVVLPGTDYCIFVSRADWRPRAGAWSLDCAIRCPR